MPRRCTVCDHPERDAIDAALATASQTYRHISSQYGLGSWNAAVRHAANHLPAHLAAAAEAAEVASADTLLGHVEALRAKCEVWHERAERLHADALAGQDMKGRAEAIKVGTQCVKACEGALTLLGRVSGELVDRSRVDVLVGVDPALLARLAALPPARRQLVVGALPWLLERAESGGGVGEGEVLEGEVVPDEPEREGGTNGNG